LRIRACIERVVELDAGIPLREKQFSAPARNSEQFTVEMETVARTLSHFS
jgi:hypothetical protein